MWLSGEDGKPHVEWGNEDNGSKSRLESMSRGRKKLLKQEERQGCHSQNEPDVEVEHQVLEVKGPRLGAIQIGTTCLGEDVVLDDVPADDSDLFVEEEVNDEVEELL